MLNSYLIVAADNYSLSTEYCHENNINVVTVKLFNFVLCCRRRHCHCHLARRPYSKIKLPAILNFEIRTKIQFLANSTSAAIVPHNLSTHHTICASTPKRTQHFLPRSWINIVNSIEIVRKRKRKKKFFDDFVYFR